MSTTSTIRECPHCGARNRVPASARGKPRCGRCHRDLPWVVEATPATFAEVAEQARPLVLVDLWAPWCQPCHMLAPVLEQVATDLAGRLKVVKVNVDEAPDLGARFDARSIPTLVLMRDGQEVDRRIGALRPTDLRAWVDAHLDGARTR